MNRLEITFNDGKKDWIDPVVSIRQTKKSLIIDNGLYKYTYRLSRITKYEVIDVQPSEAK